jgi:outer membrane receptor protein involved in Fe transport
MSRRKNLKAMLAGSTCAFALATAGMAAAQTRDFDVPAGDLMVALDAYARQSGVQIIYRIADVSGVKSGGAQGALSSDEALNQLLDGTNFEVRRDPSGAIAIAQVGSASDPQSGSAAGDGADSGTVEALIVTAQKREEDIQDVPIAISAFTQEQLENSQVAGGPDLMTQVPNFTFTKTNFSSYSIQLRGIGTQAISATVDPAVAVAFNNTPFIRNRFFEQEFYDLQRVEVLRGPQGTLYGRNATAGVVNIISQKPKFAYEAKLSADVANYSSTRLEGMVNVPLVDDVVALRLAGAWTKREGYATNEITGNPIDGRDLWSTRLSLRFAPTDRIDANLIWEHFEEDDDRLRSGKQLCKRHLPETIAGIVVPWGRSGPGGNNGGLYDETYSQGCEAASLYSPDSFQAPNGLRLPYYRALARASLPIVATNPDFTAFDPYASTTQSRDLRVIESTVDPVYKAETNLVELQVNLDLTNDLSLTSETAYLSDTLFSSQDYNRFNTRPGAFRTDFVQVNRGLLDEEGFFCDPQIGCANRLVAMDLSTAISTQFSEELRVSSNYDGPFNFSLGANFLRYDTEDKYYVFINTLSLYAASRAYYQADHRAPYVPGVTDNYDCLLRGGETPDPNEMQDMADCVYIDPNPITSLNDMGHNYFLSRNPYKLISYAIFGEAYYNLSDNLKVIAGLRWTVDKKEAPRIPSWVVAANTLGYPVAEVIEQEWREPTGRLTIDWKPDLAFTDETLLYASYAHGYKAGGANPPASGLVMWCTGCNTQTNWGLLAAQQAAVAPRTFEPEFVDAFEFGSKSTLLDGRLTVNTAAFYYDYQGYQISQIVNRAAINLNFDAKVWGLEIEADWRPLDNLKLGFKGGYENTEMAEGSRAVDMMDRTAGNPDWFVTAPFPSLPANCILPTYMVTRPNDTLTVLGAASGGGLGPCEVAYVLGLDPVTDQPYVPNPSSGGIYYFPGYPGFDPTTAPNGGAGFFKDLSGNELPNAPNYTATITADYTLPLPNDWLATLHADLYYQSEAWTRVFNTPGYDKLKAYTNVNLAAIFTNEDAGWKVMAYIKNVFDRDSITGAFLNSDDTGLTTNVFLTEPRLFGLRVTKEWNGGPWWTGANPNYTGPYPLTIEVSGQVQRQDAPYERLRPEAIANLPAELDATDIQNRDLDWGDGRALKLTWRPDGSPWFVSGAMRYGRTNNDMSHSHQTMAGPTGCAVKMYYGYDFPAMLCDPNSPKYRANAVAHSIEWMDGTAKDREEHSIVDFEVGRDVGLGFASKSALSAGVRYAEFQSSTRITAVGLTDWVIPDGFAKYYSDPANLGASHLNHRIRLDADREFRGTGPTVSWAAATRLLGRDDTGQVNLDWSLTGGVLFGKQKTQIEGVEEVGYYRGGYKYFPQPRVGPKTITPVSIPRTESVTAPLVDLSLGLSYEIQRIKIGAGYRWERYFDILDVGYAEHEDADRTIDGPYFKLSVGFGG